MKNWIVLALLIITSVPALAQQPRFGIKAGLNLSDVTTNDKEENKAIGIRPAFHIGVMAAFPLGGMWAFQPALLYSGRGAKEAHQGHSDVYKFNSLELPLNLVYRTVGNEKGHFFVGGGPSIGYNLGGKLVATDDPDENIDFAFGSAAGEIRRMDLGLNLLAGYELKKGFVISANYTRGLSNWLNTDDKWRNNMFALSVGYFFKASPKK